MFEDNIIETTVMVENESQLMKELQQSEESLKSIVITDNIVLTENLHINQTINLKSDEEYGVYTADNSIIIGSGCEVTLSGELQIRQEGNMIPGVLSEEIALIKLEENAILNIQDFVYINFEKSNGTVLEVEENAILDLSDNVEINSHNSKITAITLKNNSALKLANEASIYLDGYKENIGVYVVDNAKSKINVEEAFKVYSYYGEGIGIKVGQDALLDINREGTLTLKTDTGVELLSDSKLNVNETTLKIIDDTQPVAITDSDIPTVFKANGTDISVAINGNGQIATEFKDFIKAAPMVKPLKVDVIISDMGKLVLENKDVDEENLDLTIAINPTNEAAIIDKEGNEITLSGNVTVNDYIYEEVEDKEELKDEEIIEEEHKLEEKQELEEVEELEELEDGEIRGTIIDIAWIMDGPTINSRRVGRLKEESTVIIIGEEGSYYKIKLQGQIRYIFKWFVEVEE